MNWKNTMRFTLSALAMSALVACGGGGSGDAESANGNGTNPVGNAEGFYNGTTSNGRSLTGLVLDDGSYWVLYSAQNNSAVMAGMIQGNSRAAAGTFTSADGRDFNFEGGGIGNLSIAGTYLTKQSLGVN